MWIILGALLLALWAGAYLVFQVTAWAIHLLIIAAVVALAIHLFGSYRGRQSTGVP
jgi:hypothetical protein